MDPQLICFIDQFKFSTLLSEDCEKKIGFPQNQNNLLGYIDMNGKIDFFDFEFNRANNASIILVSDLFPLEKHYSPVRDFQVLIHSHTKKAHRLVPLKEKEFYKGYTEELEEEGTTYDSIARMIIDNC